MPPPPSPKPSNHDTKPVDETTFGVDQPGGKSTRVSRPSSSASSYSTSPGEPGTVAQLQSRLDALEYENERLRSAPVPETSDNSQFEKLQLEQQKSLELTDWLKTRLAELEQNATSNEEALRIHEQEKADLAVKLAVASEEVQQARTSWELETSLRLDEINSLRHQLADLQNLYQSKEESIQTQSSEIHHLKQNLERAYLELDLERKELGAQIDELRLAGQVKRSSC